MTKKEIIAEIKSVCESNGGRYSKSWDYLKKSELEALLNDVKYYVSLKGDKAETVETEVENDTEYVAETKATKKDIIMGLHKNNEVKCNLATAEALATEGFIIIDRYEDGVLYGEVEYDAVCEDLIDEDDLDLFDEVREGGFYHSDIEQVTDWYDMGYLIEIWYGGDGLWFCNVNWDGILIDFCKRWDNKLNEAA